MATLESQLHNDLIDEVKKLYVRYEYYVDATGSEISFLTWLEGQKVEL